MHVLAAVAVLVAISPASAQTATPTPPLQAEPGTTQPKGKVILSRSIDENGQITEQSSLPAAGPSAQPAKEPSAEDTDRQAVTFTDFDMDVHLRTAEQHIAVRALITVRNDGKVPLARIPLQLSSSLNWERIRVNGQDSIDSEGTDQIVAGKGNITAQIGGTATVQPQTVQLTASGGAASYTASVSSGASWLSVTPLSGSTRGWIFRPASSVFAIFLTMSWTALC